MTTELVTNGGISPEPILPKEPEDIAHLLILGGVESPASRFSASEALQTELSKQDLRISALHQGDANAALWLTEAGIELISMAGLRNEGGEASAIGFIGVNTIGAGETESMANRPYIHCINGIRIGVVALAEQTSEIFNSRADILSLAALDRVRMLLNQCDHVIVLVRSGLDQAELPLPEWRARYRRFIDAGASAVVDMGGAKGWEAYKQGLVFYGLGSPTGSDSLGLFLSLQRNGKLTYEARALQNTTALDFSANDAFKQRIDAQNLLFTNEKNYLRAVDEMCRRLYCEMESAQKRGVLGLFSSRAEEEQRLVSLLENESLRLMTLRAIRLKQEAERK